MWIYKSLFFLSVLLLSQIVKANTELSYSHLVKGLGPSDAWVLGANTLVEHILVGPESACRFMTQMSASTKLEMMYTLFNKQKKIKDVESEKQVSHNEFAYSACVKSGLFAKKIPEQVTQIKVTNINILMDIRQ